jgi:LacI family transcriptional regulator
MPTTPHRRTPRVALLVETTRTYSRELLAGVRSYVAAHGPWSTFLELRALDSSPPTWLKDWDGDGILTRTFSPETAELIAATGLPAVELRSTHFAGKRPFVGCNNDDIGRLVAEHLYERGYRHFAAYSQRNEGFFIERVDKFKKVVASYGQRCRELPEDNPERVPDWEQSQSRLMAWIAQLPKPIGIFAATDQLGVRLLEACQTAGVAVPEEVAVVGAENEETLCSFTTPPLSSVRFDGHAVGFAAAELLDGMMRGKVTRTKPILIAPLGIVVRGSSGELVIRDRLVARAVSLIREGAVRGLDVNELAAKLGASRSTLDRRMKSALKRSPKDEILRCRFREVERLLRQTNLTIDLIAEQTGFTHSHYLQAAFKARYKQTPGKFRRRKI